MLMLLFYAGKNRYAIDCDFVIEVIPKVHLKEIPHSPKNILGLLNYGGHPLPVVDLVQMIENRPVNTSMHSRIVILQCLHPKVEVQFFGLAVEKATETAEMDRDRFFKTNLEVADLPFLDGLYSEGNSAIQFIDVISLMEYLKPSFKS
jgi:chemotaxis-related protein WspB